MRSMAVDEAVAALDAARIASARLNTVAELLEHPQLAARDRWRSVMTPAGPVRALRSAVEPVGESPMGDVPALGQHTDDVLTFLGISADDIARLRDEGVVA
jgi:crotonobetainyl-CoA:carnitine CoA-transferase CaiB-like acyl-CoA transferase